MAKPATKPQKFIEIPANKLSIGQRKLVLGVGINDSTYNVFYATQGKRIICPFYRAWLGMLNRCYSIRSLKLNPSYNTCKVCKQWLLFSNFRKWMINENWCGNSLDKDIIKPKNKVYSPEFCVFVSKSLNYFLTYKTRSSNKYPTGVRITKKGKFVSRCRSGLGKKMHIGTYNTPEEASSAYNEFKSAHIKKIAFEQSDTRVRDGLLRHAEIINNTE